MTRSFAAMFLVALLAPPVLAADLSLFASGEAEYDDNAFRSIHDKQDDVFFRIRPGLKIHEDRGDDLNYSLQYELPAELAVDHGQELNDLDHVASGNFIYHVNDRLDIVGLDRFRYLRSTLRRNFESDSVESGLGVPSISDRRERVRLNDAELEADYRFAPRLVGRVVANHRYFDSTREDRSQVDSISGRADVTYRLTSEHQLGGGARFTYQDFAQSTRFSGSQSYIYNVFGSWRWTIDETTALDVSLGPSLIQTDQDRASRVSSQLLVPYTVLNGTPFAPAGVFDENGASLAGQSISPGSLLVENPFQCAVLNGVPVRPCGSNVIVDPASNPTLWSAIRNTRTAVTNLNPGGGQNTTVNLFAQVVLTKRWTPTLATALRYSREQDNASGLGGTVIADAVSLSNTWDITERWQLALRGDWTNRQSVADQVGTFYQVEPLDPASLTPSPTGTIAGLQGTAFNASVRSVNIDTQRWGVAGRVTHQLFRNTRVYLQVTYDQQQSSGGTRGATSDFSNFLATFGVRHTFEPIKLW